LPEATHAYGNITRTPRQRIAEATPIRFTQCHINAEAFIISQTLGGNKIPESAANNGGGGSFGGGGTSGEF
jgi:uncharacterized membrane protein YgcG